MTLLTHSLVYPQASQHFFPLVHSNDINLHLVDKILGIHTDSKTGENYMLVRSKDRDGQVSAETERIPCDAVIYSTGFHFSFPFIKPALAAKMQIPEDNLGGAPRFFRTILPLCYRETATIAFNGLFNSSSCACDIEVAAHWISELFIQGGVKAGDEGRGILKVPDVKEMDRQVYLFDQLDKHFEAGGGTKEGKVRVCFREFGSSSRKQDRDLSEIPHRSTCLVVTSTLPTTCSWTWVFARFVMALRGQRTGPRFILLRVGRVCKKKERRDGKHWRNNVRTFERSNHM